MPMATSWSFVPEDPYKSERELVHMLVDVVAKGGNLLLNIGPGPDGRWHDAAYDRLAALGSWLKVNGEAIYATRAVAPYVEGRYRLTRAEDGAVYALYLADEGEAELPARITLEGVRPAPGATVELVGSGLALKWEPAGNGFTARFPPGTRAPSPHAWAVRISRVAS
jgi:alpha-L-fucosidase